MKTLFNKTKRAFTLVELLVVIAIVALVVSMVVPAMRTSKIDSVNRTADGNSKTLNDGTVRARVSPDVDQVALEALVSSNNITNLATFLVEQGFIGVK